MVPWIAIQFLEQQGTSTLLEPFVPFTLNRRGGVVAHLHSLVIITRPAALNLQCINYLNYFHGNLPFFCTKFQFIFNIFVLEMAVTYYHKKKSPVPVQAGNWRTSSRWYRFWFWDCNIHSFHILLYVWIFYELGAAIINEAQWWDNRLCVQDLDSRWIIAVLEVERLTQVCCMGTSNSSPGSSLNCNSYTRYTLNPIQEKKASSHWCSSMLTLLGSLMSHRILESKNGFRLFTYRQSIRSTEGFDATLCKLEVLAVTHH